MTNLSATANAIDPEVVQALLREYFGLIFRRFDALVASFLLGYVSLYLMGATVSSTGPQMWFALVATIVTTLGCLYSQLVWAKAN